MGREKERESARERMHAGERVLEKALWLLLLSLTALGTPVVTCPFSSCRPPFLLCTHVTGGLPECLDSRWGLGNPALSQPLERAALGL